MTRQTSSPLSIISLRKRCSHRTIIYNKNGSFCVCADIPTKDIFRNMDSKKIQLKELAILFLKLGTIAFGGPAAHIAMMENEVVKKKKWMNREHFLDLISATNLIPGPNSSEMAMHCGHERAGKVGLVIAGLCFILPAILITSVFAWFYVLYGQLPKVEPFIYGIQPAVIAIILAAVVNLGQKALKDIQTGILGALTLLACLAGMNEIAALIGCGLTGLCLYYLKTLRHTSHCLFPLPLFSLIPTGIALENLKIFGIFLKTGALLYGSGYVLFAFLDAELVNTGLLSRQQLLDAIAIGQFTPGPVLSTATFVGWQLNGLWGGLWATVGIFLPSFILVALLNPVIPHLRKSKAMAAFLDAINMGSVAVILAACILMGSNTLSDWRTVVIACLSFCTLLIFRKTNSIFIVIGGALSGYLLHLI